MQDEKNTCQVCQRCLSTDLLIHARFMRSSLQNTALKFFEKFNLDGFICLDDLRNLRDYRIQETVGKLNQINSAIKDKVIDSINNEKIISENVDEEYTESLTFGEKASDAVARFGGSWLFICLFSFMIAFWILFNGSHNKAFDPFPFIFLNLFLSCIAAFQAPIIMMSQNRQNQKDRLRDIADYQVNLKAELEIQELHHKLDQFFKEEWNKLIEIQKLQLEVSEDIIDAAQALKSKNIAQG